MKKKMRKKDYLKPRCEAFVVEKQSLIATSVIVEDAGWGE